MFATTTSAEFRSALSDHLLRVMGTGERLLITRNGRDAAALVSVRDLEALEEVERRREDMVRLRHERRMEEFRALKEGLR